MADGRASPAGPAPPRSARAPRCADRCDSSESSDSGVAALSCAECSGCSSGCSGCGGCSDSTEPGSPGSPASTGSSGSPWRWPLGRKRSADKSTSNLNNNNNNNGVETKLPGAQFEMPCEKPESRVLPHALDVEHCLSQIASIPKHIIHKTAPQQCSTSRATPTSECGALPPPPVPPLQPNKPQQASITEYFKSQMKPTNGLKREVAAWFNNKALPETKKGAEGFNNYIAYLSKTLHNKGLLDSPKDMTEEQMDVDMQKTEPEKMPLPRLNSVVKSNNNMSSVVKKTDFHKTNCTPQSKASKEVRVRGLTKQIKKYRIAEAKKAVIPKLNTNKTQQSKDRQSTGATATNLNCVYPNVVSKAQTLVDGNNVLVNSNTLPMAQVSTLPDHLRQLLVKVQVAHSRTLNPQDSKSSNRVNGETNLEQVPSVNHHSAQMHNGDIKPLHRTESFMSTPPVSVASSNSNLSVPMSPAVMLATVRMPEHSVPGSHPDTQSTTSTNHISITNQNGMNNSFMLPLVQNLNGTLLQIPGLVTKVGQNSVMPMANPNLLATTPSNGLTHPQSQMFINGAFLKINGHIQANLNGLNKPIGSNNIPNVSYAVTPKNLPTSMPTMIGSKPNFTMNLNHPMFVSSSGFIFNSLGNVVTTQTNTGLTHMQPFTNNVVLTTPVHPGVHIAPHMNNALSSLPLSTGSIPLSSIKLDGINPVFITSQSQQPTYSIPEMKDDSMMIPNTPSIVPTSLELCSNPVNEISNIPNSGVVENMDTSNIKNSSEKVVLQSSETCNGTIEEKETCIFSEEKNYQIEMKTENAFIVSDETKSSIDSVSLDNNRNNDSPSVDSPGTEISKEIDEDSLNNSVVTNQEFPISQTSPVFCEPKTIRFPAKKIQCNEPRTRTVRSSNSEIKLCQWNNCSRQFEDGSDLLEHLQECHVNAQAGKETFRCLWQGCKVYNRPSCSRSWLERHVPSHGGTKLFRCIVDDCGQRFNTHIALHKHVNNHFTENPNNLSSTKKSVENSSGPKLIRRNGKRLRYRRQPWSARLFDYFDAGIMEGLQYRIVQTAVWRNGGAAGQTMSIHKSELYSQERTPHCITMAATILARRINADFSLPECLVRWSPPDIKQDEWLLEKDFVPIKDVPIASLDSAARNVLYSSFCASYRSSKLEISQSSRTNLNNISFRRSSLKTINGFPKVVNGKILDVHHSHNNNLKTDRIMCVAKNNEIICNTKSESEIISESSNQNCQSIPLVGAAKRKHYRRSSQDKSDPIRNFCKV